MTQHRLTRVARQIIRTALRTRVPLARVADATIAYHGVDATGAFIIRHTVAVDAPRFMLAQIHG